MTATRRDELLMAAANEDIPTAGLAACEIRAAAFAGGPYLLVAAQAAVKCLNDLTTAEFRIGGDRGIRDMLGAAIEAAIPDGAPST